MSLNFQSAGTLLDYIKENEIEYISLRFTDTKGRMHHMSMVASYLDEDSFEDGIMFDGSSIEGWKVINDSDMILFPDYTTAYIDPFSNHSTMAVFCSILEPSTGQNYERDPRSVAIRAEAYLNSTGIGDTAYIGAEPEFFIFEDVNFENSPRRSFYALDHKDEAHWNNSKSLEHGNHGYRVTNKGGYVPVMPIDSENDLRAEMVNTLHEMGVDIDKHHHEVATAQHELGLKHSTLVKSADWVQLYKYGVQNVAYLYGKTATFMPKPLFGDNGSGMHVHQSIWQGGKPLFAGSSYADLSEFALFYIGGIIKHAKALNAFTNPSTNSYKRLVPGYEAPVLLAYSARNRSASCRIPHGANPKAKRIEIRFPDALANPYLAFSAMLMAGLDGIQNKIHPGDAMDKNLYDLPAEELEGIPTVCGSLREALESLDQDRGFLKKGDVFTDDLIDSYLELKWEEVISFETAPHPIEFEMYYNR